MNFLKRLKGDQPAKPTRVSVHLNARVQPTHRGDIYEDPLNEILSQIAPGSMVSGGGSAFSPETGVESCDIEVDVIGDPAQVVPQVIFALESFGAPRGSWVTVDGGDQVPFGATHGLALELDGASLPAEVYADNDVNDLIEALAEELGETADLQSWWEGPEWTSLFFYGHDLDQMRGVLERADAKSDLARGSRVTTITP